MYAIERLGHDTHCALCDAVKGSTQVSVATLTKQRTGQHEKAAEAVAAEEVTVLAVGTMATTIAQGGHFDWATIVISTADASTMRRAPVITTFQPRQTYADRDNKTNGSGHTCITKGLRVLVAPGQDCNGDWWIDV